jgi:hypothetical protein
VAKEDGGGQAPQSFSASLVQLHQDISKAKLAPDADMRFCTMLEQAVLSRLKQGSQQPGQQPGQPGQPGPGGPGGPGGGGPKPGPGSPPLSQPGAPAGGGAANPQMQSQGAPSYGNGPTQGLSQNPDEMRRVIAAMGGGGQ